MYLGGDEMEEKSIDFIASDEEHLFCPGLRPAITSPPVPPLVISYYS